MTGEEMYLEKETFFQRLDPRTKMLLLVTFFVIILYFENPLWIAPVSFLVIMHGLLSRSMSNLRPVRHILIVLAVSSVVLWNVFAGGQTPLFWVVQQESLEYSIGRTLVLLSLVVEGIIFLSTTRYEEMTLGLIRMGLPYRVGFSLSTAFRMIPMIIASARAVAQAQQSRGLDLDTGSIPARIKKYLPLLVPVFLSLIRSTNTFVMALESRGFCSQKRRTYYLQIGFKKNDILCIIGLVLLFAAATYFKIAGYGTIAGLRRF